MNRTPLHSLSSCLLACFSIACALIVIAPAHGTILTFNLTEEFSGAFAPESATTPWLVAVFDDDDTAGMVTLTMSAPNLTLEPGSGDDEHVNNWFFNLDPALNANDLVFSVGTQVGGALNEGAIVVSTDNTDANAAFQANGDGFFDIRFDFATNNGPNIKFGLGDAVSFDITLAGLTANSFNVFSFQDGGQGSFLTASQVLGIGTNDESGWIGAVPEPTSGMLLLVGCFAGGLFAGRRKRR